MSTWPSVLTSLTDPNAGDRLNAPSHSSIESAQNDGIEKLETFIGTLSSAVGTLVYDIRATASDGGGHVQGVNKGGTNQTSYNKGDMLIGQSSSVLTKLAVGVNGQALVANSDAAVGMYWGSIAGVPASVTTIYPLNPLMNQYTEQRFDTTTSHFGRVGFYFIPSPIRASTLSLRINETTTGGNAHFTLYREDGASSIFTVSPSITGNQANVSVSINPPVVLSQGNYYAMYNTTGTTNAIVALWGIGTGTTSVLGLGSIVGRPALGGNYLINSSTPPASIVTTSSTISFVIGGGVPVFRLDG